ncbi:MAG: hypothetical protein V1838_04115 [Patescibacteria group bacterium]
MLRSVDPNAMEVEVTVTLARKMSEHKDAHSTEYAGRAMIKITGATSMPMRHHTAFISG